MSTLPTNFRLPPSLDGKAEPEVVEAIGYHDDAITDLQQAIPSLKSQIDALTTSTSSTTTTENVTTNSSTTIIAPSTIGMVNNQSGETSYSTAQSDYGAFIILDDASAIAVTLSTGTAIQLPWFASILNLGAGAVTLTPETGTINGFGSLSLPTNNAVQVGYDGTDFWAEPLVASPVNMPAVASQWLNSYDSATGEFTQTQPAVGDVTGAAPLASPTFTGTVTQPDATVLTAPTTATSATAGSASALPAAPAGYLTVSLGGTDFKVPYYAV